MKRSPNKPQLKNEVFRTPQTPCPDEMLPQAQTRCSCQLQPHILITTRTSPAGAWGAEGFNVEGVTCCFCGLVFLFRVFYPFLVNFVLFFAGFDPFSGYFAVFLRVLGVIQCVLDVFRVFPMYFDHNCCRQSPRVHAARARSQKTSPILSPTHPDLVH